MNGAVVILIIVLAVGVVVVRRRSAALALVCLQSGILATLATIDAVHEAALRAPAAGLWLRVVVIAAVLGIGIVRTREPRPVRAGIEPMTRAVIALISLLAVGIVVPPLGLVGVGVERGAVALVVLGVVIAMSRRATIIQILGIVVAENAATMLALAGGDAVPVVIELGVVFDLVLIAIVATTFHARIFGAFGSGDAQHLRGLHD